MNPSRQSSLHYTSSNEDTGFELELLKQHSENIFVIAGSGSRVIPLFSKLPKRMTVVDASLHQLALVRLREALVLKTDSKTYSMFLGYPSALMTPQERERIFSTLKLSNPDRKLLEFEFKLHKWSPPIAYGLNERSLARLGRISNRMLFPAAKEMFRVSDEVKYREYLLRRFPWRRWSIVTTTLVMAYERLRRRTTALPRQSLSLIARYHRDAIERMLRLGPARTNYLAQLIFLGYAKYPEGNPIECDPEILIRAKHGIEGCETTYIHADIADAIEAVVEPIAFASLSDVASYLKHEEQRALLPKLHKRMAGGGIIVLRHYLTETDALNRTGFADVSAEYAELAAREKTQMYRIEVLRRL